MSIIHRCSLQHKLNPITQLLAKCTLSTSRTLLADHAQQEQQQQDDTLTTTRPTRRAGVIAIKKGMTAIYDPWGVRVPVTLLQLNKVYVTQAKTPKVDGHYGIQVGAVEVKNEFRINRAQLIHCQKATVPFGLRKYTAFKVSKSAMLPVGTQITTSHYRVGEYVDVSGTTVGKGFAGVMKRFNFKGQGASHGVSLTHRHPGSIGQCQDPGKVWKNKKMPGRMGNKPHTVFGLQIVQIDHDAGVLYVRGAVPGHDEQFIRVRDCIKKKNRMAGPLPTDHSSKSGTEYMPKTGSDPMMKF